MSGISNFKDLVRKPLDEFIAEAKKRGAKYVRVMEIDGEPQMGTMDYREDRLNVKVKTRGDQKIVVEVINFS